MSSEDKDLTRCIRAACERWSLGEKTSEAISEIWNSLTQAQRMLQTLDSQEAMGLGLLCANGDEKAIAVTNREFVEPLKRKLAHMKLSDALLDDVLQAVRSKLTLGSNDSPAALIRYAHQGNPQGLAILIGTREALSMIRKDKRLVFDDEQVVDSVMEEMHADEVLAKDEAKSMFRKSFRNAMQTLTPANRNLLRLSIFGGIDRRSLAKMHNIHPATLRRRLAEIRASLLQETQKSMRADFGVSSQEFESVIRFLGNSLDASWSKILGPTTET